MEFIMDANNILMDFHNVLSVNKDLHLKMINFVMQIIVKNILLLEIANNVQFILDLIL